MYNRQNRPVFRSVPRRSGNVSYRVQLSFSSVSTTTTVATTTATTVTTATLIILVDLVFTFATGGH